jgi:hypothetical protein
MKPNFLVQYEDGTLQLASEQEVSRLMDMRDTIEEGFKVFFLSDIYPDGLRLLPITNQHFQRNSAGEFIYATSELIAGGEVVGHVNHTDH